MYLIIPVRIEGKVNPNRHTVAQAQRLDEMKTRSITGNFKATVTSTIDEGLKILAKEIASIYVENGVKPEDIRLVYSFDSIVNGRVWGGSHVVSTAEISDLI